MIMKLIFLSENFTFKIYLRKGKIKVSILILTSLLYLIFKLLLIFKVTFEYFYLSKEMNYSLLLILCCYLIKNNTKST